ncbi:glycosyltransferase family 4 protein [Mycolicibacterium frederiksbergense]|uniref:glycosyltransferase family 4 protein n=1 Tax=Mycolicibacterium frederiksbergense TaxID=117567 RepID=UPI0024743332|nr:glycosyltransferase family 4 protein [Mycolicibacterium frederiksbergense]
MPKSAAIVSAVDPYPTNAGKKVVLAGFNDYFAQRLGANNVHYLMVGGPANPEFPVRVHSLPRPRVMSAVGNVLAKAATGRVSIQEALLRSRALGTAIRRTLDSIDPDLEVYDTIRMAQHAPTHRRDRQVCYLDDLFSERYQSMLRTAERYPDVDINPLGNFATHVPRPLRPLAAHPWGQQLLLTVEQGLVRRSEDRDARRFSATLLMNETEAGLLRHRIRSATAPVLSIPPLIAEPSGARAYRGAPEFVFLGLLSLPHNDDGLRSFLSDVWPLVRSARPDATLRVIGRDPRPGLIDEAARHGGSVIMEGFVPDLGEILGRAAALVNPLRFGSGVKLKIIEALGRGVPVVSTTVGADGVAAGDDEGILVCDDHPEMADLLLGATDLRRNDALSAAAREHFARRYSRAAVFECYDRTFGLA